MTSNRRDSFNAAFDKRMRPRLKKMRNEKHMWYETIKVTTILLDEVCKVMPQQEKERIERTIDREGNVSAARELIGEMQRYNGFAVAFLKGLDQIKQGDLAKEIVRGIEISDLPESDDLDFVRRLKPVDNMPDSNQENQEPPPPSYYTCVIDEMEEEQRQKYDRLHAISRHNYIPEMRSLSVSNVNNIFTEFIVDEISTEHSCSVEDVFAEIRDDQRKEYQRLSSLSSEAGTTNTNSLTSMQAPTSDVTRTNDIATAFPTRDEPRSEFVANIAVSTTTRDDNFTLGNTGTGDAGTEEDSSCDTRNDTCVADVLETNGNSAPSAILIVRPPLGDVSSASRAGPGRPTSQMNNNLSTINETTQNFANEINVKDENPILSDVSTIATSSSETYAINIPAEERSQSFQKRDPHILNETIPKQVLEDSAAIGRVQLEPVVEDIIDPNMNVCIASNDNCVKQTTNLICVNDDDISNFKTVSFWKESPSDGQTDYVCSEIRDSECLYSEEACEVPNTACPLDSRRLDAEDGDRCIKFDKSASEEKRFQSNFDKDSVVGCSRIHQTCSNEQTPNASATLECCETPSQQALNDLTMINDLGTTNVHAGHINVKHNKDVPSSGDTSVCEEHMEENQRQTNNIIVGSLAVIVVTLSFLMK